MSLDTAVVIILPCLRKGGDDTLMIHPSDYWEAPVAYLNIASKCRTFLSRIHGITLKP